MEGFQPWVVGAAVGVVAALVAHSPRHYASWRAWTRGFYRRLLVYVGCGALSGLLGVWLAILLPVVPPGQHPVVLGLAAGLGGHLITRIQWRGFGTEPAEVPVSALGWLARWFHDHLRADTYNAVHTRVCAYSTGEVVAVAARISERVASSDLSEPQRRVAMQDIADALEVMATRPASPDGRPRVERLVTEYVVNLHLPPDVLEAFRRPLVHADGRDRTGEDRAPG